MSGGERILVYGVTGSGKSTLAAAISRRTGLPWHCMDDLTWEPGWTEVPGEEQRRRVANVCAGEHWIIDTAYSQWLDIVLARAETIVALDYPRWVSARTTPAPHVHASCRLTDLQRQHRDVAAGAVAQLDHRLALPVLLPEAGAHPGVGRSPRRHESSPHALPQADRPVADIAVRAVGEPDVKP